jgi:hypothetical protein
MTVSAQTAEARLRSFIAKFDPDRQRLIRAVRRQLRASFPGANELVYDNYNFFVIGYSPTERPSDTIVSIAAGSGGVSLYFMHGARLPDPAEILLGSGKQGRFVRLSSASVLKHAAVQSLLRAAVARSKQPIQAGARGKLVIRSVSAKQRARR